MDVAAGKRVPFSKGNPGRPKGSRNKVPTVVKQTMKAIVEEIIKSENTTLRRALMQGIRSHPRFSFNFLRLVAEYNEGKPKETLDLNTQFNEQVMETAARGMRKKMDLLMKTILKRAKDGDEQVPDSGSGAGEDTGSEAEPDHTADGE